MYIYVCVHSIYIYIQIVYVGYVQLPHLGHSGSGAAGLGLSMWPYFRAVLSFVQEAQQGN